MQGKFKLEYHIHLVLIQQQVIATLSELPQKVAVILFSSKLLAAT